MESWERVKAVQRMQDYIEEHLTEPITLYMLAKVARYSPWHSARIFKELTGKTPFEYIRILRLSRAAVKLRDQDIRIIDVAFDFVFDSHEGFTRAFSRQFGMTPRYYSKNTPPLKLFIPARIRDYYLKLQKGEGIMAKNTDVKTVFVQVVDRPERKLILKRGIKATHYFEYCEEVGCDIWGILSSIKKLCMNRLACGCRKTYGSRGPQFTRRGLRFPSLMPGKFRRDLSCLTCRPAK